jgi:hypothetical protein
LLCASDDCAEACGSELLADSAEGVAQFGASRRAARRSTRIGVSTLLSKRRSDDPLVELTPREREVLELMAERRRTTGSRTSW